MPAHAHNTHKGRKVEQRNQKEKKHQQAGARQTLPTQAQVFTQVEHGPQQQHLHNRGGTGNNQRQPNDKRRQPTVFTHDA